MVIGPNVSKPTQIVLKQEASQDSILLHQHAKKGEGLVTQAV